MFERLSYFQWQVKGYMSRDIFGFLMMFSNIYKDMSSSATKLKPRLNLVPFFNDEQLAVDTGFNFLEGFIALTDEYFYIFSNKVWRRTALSPAIGTFPIGALLTRNVSDGLICYNREYLFIYKNGWKTIAFSPIDPRLQDRVTFSVVQSLDSLTVLPGPILAGTYGVDSNISFDKQYFYFRAGNVWRKFAISEFLGLTVITNPVITGMTWDTNSYTWDQDTNIWNA